MILIAGAGLTGLSAAYLLKQHGVDHTVLEKEPEPGGLCRSFQEGGYTFDCSGHLLCLRDPGIAKWIQDLLEQEINFFERKASIYLDGSWIPYPFQAHLGALPRSLMEECLAGLILSAVKGLHWKNLPQGDFGSWVSSVFGEGISRHFFVPYNEKLFGVPVGELAVEGLEWSIPRPSLTEAIDGALGARHDKMGYNPLFAYPSKGGIERLPRAMAARLDHLRYSSAIEVVRWKEKKALLQTGEALPYEKIVSTIPLPKLLLALDPEPPELQGMASSFKWVSVWVLNVGVGKEGVSNQHWIYFPEKAFPFFRVGCYTSFGPHLAPAGRSSLYVESGDHVVRALGLEKWIRQVVEGLVRCGLLTTTSQVETVSPLFLPVAYVIHDRARLRNLPLALAFLEEQGIYCAGRYGAWGYGTMEDAILQGRDAARKVVG